MYGSRSIVLKVKGQEPLSILAILNADAAMKWYKIMINEKVTYLG